MNSIYQEQAEITELCGVLDWSDVVEWFDGMTVEQIKAEADHCWPQDEDNQQFAERVSEALD